MPLVELTPPSGFRNHGTDLQSEGRWHDGSLVRWHEGSMRPVGGWVDRTGDVEYAAPPRGMLAWQDNTANRWIAAGTYAKLYATTSGGGTYDITPAGFTSGAETASVNTGYGGGPYGSSFYGQTRPDSGNYGEATSWSMDNWGQYLIACSNADGKLYEWQLNTATPAAQIANSPTGCSGLVVTGERFIFALGAGGVKNKVAWADFEDNTQWVASSTNQAGDVTLQTNGQIMAAVAAQGQTIIVTDQDCHRGVFQGPPFIFQFERVGAACGAVARKVVVDTPAGVFWMGQQNFFRYDGSTVSEVPCDVFDAVFSDINPAQISKSWGVSNGQNGEVWWFYCSADATEIDSYVAYDYHDNHWLIGKLPRTAGVDRGVFRAPIMASDAGRIYNHETGFNYEAQTVYAQTGPFKIGAGDNLAVVTNLIPDELALGSVTTTFKTRSYPNSAEASHGPYTLTDPTSVRFQGRQVRMRVDAVDGDWRVGKFRFDAKAGGRR